MRIHEVLIAPAAGYLSAAGKYTLGLSVDNMTEVSIVDKYCRGITDALDDSGVRNRTLPVRKPPGIKEGERHHGIMPNTLILHCRIGWCDKPPSKRPLYNKSRIFQGAGDYGELPELISETMAHWGQIYVIHGHQGCNPVVCDEDPLLKVEGTAGLRLEPFILNGPAAEQYCGKLEELGRDLGRTIADFIIAKDYHARNKPSR